MLYNLGQLAKLAAAAIASNLPGRENISASRRSIRRFVITEKAPTRHYAKQALTQRSLNVKFNTINIERLWGQRLFNIVSSRGLLRDYEPSDSLRLRH